MSAEAHMGAVEAAVDAYSARSLVDGSSERCMEDAITAYLKARSAILCNAEPDVWTIESAISNGFGFIKMQEHDMIWDYAAQDWSNTTVPLYTALEPAP